MKSAVLEGGVKASGRPGISIFDPRRKGTDEDTLLKKHRPDLWRQKKNPSEKYRLAQNLFRLRTSKGMSQVQLARKAQVGAATYQRMEECQPSSNPGFDVIVKLARALEVDVAQLVAK